MVVANTLRGARLGWYLAHQGLQHVDLNTFKNNQSDVSEQLKCFCLFDKCDRAFKASHVLNTVADTFRCKLNFEISGTDYYIERNATTKKNGDVTVSVDFWKVNEHGDVVSYYAEFAKQQCHIHR